MVGNLVRRLVHGETDTEARRNSGRIFWTGGKLRGNGPGAAPWWRRSAKIEGGRFPNDVLRRAAQDIWGGRWSVLQVLTRGRGVTLQDRIAQQITLAFLDQARD